MDQSWKLALLPALVLASSCNLLNTSDSEDARGRGVKVFDPYASTASGSISLSLLYFNGCAMLPDGEAVSRGTLNLPDYPEACPRLADGFTPGEPSPPTATLTVVGGRRYFLRELTAMDTVIGAHTAFNDRSAPLSWLSHQSRFKSLDWSGAGTGREEWRSMSGGTFQRETYYENAAWMLSNTDTFTIEVLDRDGQSRSEKVVYDRKDFLAETPVTGHTRASWTVYGLLRPNSPGDLEPHPSPNFQGPQYLTTAKVSFAGSTNPFKSFIMPDLNAEAVIRVTWSLMPDQPFVFPVTVVREQDLPPDCYKLDADGLATSEKVACGFGLAQTARFNPPADNRKFYLPGEKVDFQVSLRDGDGNGLHPRDQLPSYNEYRQNLSNGISYFNEQMYLIYREAGTHESGFRVVGPLQDLGPTYGTYKPPYFAFPQTSDPTQFYSEPGLIRVIAGYGDAKQPTRYSFQLPPDAKPGTYALLLKGHRYFMGERLNRLEPIFFQVGQAETTRYPGRIGNCQICHNGVNSLVNLHHGLSVDNVEACQGCHYDLALGHMSDFVHRLHMGSRKYPEKKSDCSVCHLTKESAVRPSIVACDGCHNNSHGTKYFDAQFADITSAPNSYGNCAQTCHAESLPKSHIYPQ